jgi:hypothetical protein
MGALAVYWAKAVSERWASLCRINRLKCMKLTEASDGVLTSGIFFRANDLSFGAAAIVFDATSFVHPVRYHTPKTKAEGWLCGQDEGNRIHASATSMLLPRFVLT